MHNKKINKTASKTINENLMSIGGVRNNEPLPEEPTSMDGGTDSNTDDGSVSESASACTTTLSRPRDLFRPSGFIATGAAAGTMTKPRGGRRGPSQQKQQQQQHLPQIPSSMSLHSFRNVTATATMTKPSRNAKTPQGAATTAKYLDLSSPAASKQHFTMNSSASTHDFASSAAAADYTGKTRLSCRSFVV